MAMAGGRPIEYNEDVVIRARAYLEECVDEPYQLTRTDGDKSTTFENKIKVKLPTIEGLALYLKIHRDTVYQWEKEYTEFSDIISELRHKQAESLINNGLSGDYNPTIAKVLLSKHGYREEVKQETEHSGSVGFTGIEIVKPDDEKVQA
jgi:hypothetical protein